MKYKVLGPRVLLKMKKSTDTYEGYSIAMAEDQVQKETRFQTIGIVEQVGPTVKDYEGFADLKVGDKVVFLRYGAQTLPTKKEDEYEYWIINGKDILCIEVQ